MILRALACALALGAAAQAPKLTVHEVVDRANKVLRGDSSRARVLMSITTPDWSRELDIESWNSGRTKALILIHAPPKEKGTATLRRGEEMWMWMARVERLLKIPPAMMHSSWQGSDFDYEDIVKADSIVKDYEHKLLKSSPGPGYDVYRIQADPKPDAPVVWGKVLFEAGVFPDGWVIPLREEDYNERGELVRTIVLSQVRELGGRRVPTRLECAPERKKGRKTVLTYRDIQFDVNLPDSFFSVSRLQK
ncbi:MAG TPA: outer membrane lipoprotein-sorting protein [Elusimicrobiota bacterium]|jgi:outer membrane lipoprotein-sorting protein|nr:outer membrane lipoprotein-sorting protein [Elusimicrobiota bacterium]